jgi:hypothetical protein
VRYLCLRFSYVILVNTGGKLFVDLAWFPMAAGVPQGGRVNDSVTTLHEIYFYLWEFFMFTYTIRHSINFVSWIRLFSMMQYTVSLHTLISRTSFLLSWHLPVKIGTFLFVLNLSNYLLPDVIGLAWRLCLAQHSMAQG